MCRILVIDDEKPIRDLLKKAFERKGYEVDTAENGQVGIELFQKSPADLIITDIIMPVKEGLETITELRRDYPNVKIIAMSGGLRYGPELNLSAAKTLGANMTFSKPVNLLHSTNTISISKLWMINT